MARNVKFAPGEFYHLYNRGTEKRRIFTTASDYERFLALLYASNGTEALQIANLYKLKSYRGRILINLVREIERGEPLVDIGAYCLMPNHFHLLLREKEEGGISRFMQKLITGYTMYFNKKYERSGALFQGKFRANHAGDDRYLKYLLAYIHLNPADTKKNLEQYPYSSYIDYCGVDRTEQCILNKKSLPEYFNSPENFRASMEEWLRENKNPEVEPREKTLFFL